MDTRACAADAGQDRRGNRPRLEVRPCCGGELQRCNRSRNRIIEDIPEQITPAISEHTIHKDTAPLQKHVEPVVVDAMPNATLGHNMIALSSWFHYGLGITIGQVGDILTNHLHTQITPGVFANWPMPRIKMPMPRAWAIASANTAISCSRSWTCRAFHRTTTTPSGRFVLR
jgi:hypothetical protein